MNTVHYGWRDGKNTVISLVMVTEKLTSQMKLHPQKKNGVISTASGALVVVVV